MAFDPNQPRQQNGEWTDSGGPTPRGKMTISNASHRMQQQGWELGPAKPWSPGQKETVYQVKHTATGKVHEKTAREIIRKFG